LFCRHPTFFYWHTPTTTSSSSSSATESKRDHSIQEKPEAHIRYWMRAKQQKKSSSRVFNHVERNDEVEEENFLIDLDKVFDRITFF
jgi:hypothetical protein